MNERFLQYVWHKRLFNLEQTLVDGRQVEIIDVGIPNDDEGPDFFNAKVRIDGIEWAGNVEIHVRSGDWLKHAHHRSKQYDNVILHVVGLSDQIIAREDGTCIPQLELAYSKKVADHLTFIKSLQQDRGFVKCHTYFKQLEVLYVSQWIERLAIERLESKVSRIEKGLLLTCGDWESAFYVTLSRNLGFGVNSDLFERLAQITPLQIIAKHRHSLFEIEALLFGQAGLLAGVTKDDYHEKLQIEYHYLQCKYQLIPMDGGLWKQLRIRPANFPCFRIAQLASLLQAEPKRLSKIVDSPKMETIRTLFRVELSPYWHSHLRFGYPSVHINRQLSPHSIDLIVINTIVPFIFSYGEGNGREALKDAAIDLLEGVNAEKNSIIAHFESVGVRVVSALESQGLIQLKSQYCDRKDCIRCGVAHQLLSHT